MGREGQQGSAEAIHLLQCHAQRCLAQLLIALDSAHACQIKEVGQKPASLVHASAVVAAMHTTSTASRLLGL